MSNNKKEEKKHQHLFSRRDVLKLGGLASLGAGLVSVASLGFINGKSVDTYSGWEGQEGEIYFDREPFQVDKPPYKILRTEIKKVNGLDAPSDRSNLIKELGLDKTGVENATGALKEYYEQNPDIMEKDKVLFEEIEPKRKETEKTLGNRNALWTAWNSSWDVLKPKKPGLPEVSDWEGVRKPAYEIKDPKKMSEIIKKVAGTFGAKIVGITKLNPAWVYETSSGGRGWEPGEKVEMPSWWEYAIVVGVPHEWDSIIATPAFAGEKDGTVQAAVVGARLERYVKELGYPARLHAPDSSRFDILVPPVMVDAGLGEQGRFSFVITPEFGGNVRTAVITTNLPLEVDKPIDIGVRDFCKECKLCAEICPSKAISFDDEPGEIRGRGVEAWFIDVDACLHYRQSVPFTQRCKLCMTVCPWTRKDNWIHKAAKGVIPRDKTSLVAKGLTWAQESFYEIPDVSEYTDPKWGSYRKAPWFLDVDGVIE